MPRVPGESVEGVAGCFGCHAPVREHASLVVDEREQGGGLGVAGVLGFEELGHVGHDSRFYPILASQPDREEE